MGLVNISVADVFEWTRSGFMVKGWMQESIDEMKDEIIGQRFCFNSFMKIMLHQSV